jgi:hypothetical protein
MNGMPRFVVNKPGAGRTSAVVGDRAPGQLSMWRRLSGRPRCFDVDISSNRLGPKR